LFGEDYLIDLIDATFPIIYLEEDEFVGKNCSIVASLPMTIFYSLAK